MKRASTRKSISCRSSSSNNRASAPARSFHGITTNGSLCCRATGSRSRRLLITSAGSARAISPARQARISPSKQCGSRVTRIAMRWRRRGSVRRSVISICSDAASRARPACMAARSICRSFQDACSVMLNWPRVTCSSSASMLAFCSKRKFVTRATTPVLSRPITVRVANFFIVGPMNRIQPAGESRFSALFHRRNSES
jgi:hypothetical protein